jgi:serine/threonine protein kinase
MLALLDVFSSQHQEMEILSTVPAHENIIRLRYYNVKIIAEEDDTRLLTLYMDYLPSNLGHFIKDHPTGLPLSLIKTYSHQLFSGLAHLAQRNIVHRDLLPRNILIDPSNQTLKVADFGCAKIVMPDLPNHPRVGAWQYRAVELLLGATHYNSKAGASLTWVTDVRYLVSRCNNSRDDVGKISLRNQFRGQHAREYPYGNGAD